MEFDRKRNWRCPDLRQTGPFFVNVLHNVSTYCQHSVVFFPSPFSLLLLPDFGCLNCTDNVCFFFRLYVWNSNWKVGVCRVSWELWCITWLYIYLCGPLPTPPPFPFKWGCTREAAVWRGRAVFLHTQRRTVIKNELHIYFLFPHLNYLCNLFFVANDSHYCNIDMIQTLEMKYCTVRE